MAQTRLKARIPVLCETVFTTPHVVHGKRMTPRTPKTAGNRLLPKHLARRARNVNEEIHDFFAPQNI